MTNAVIPVPRWRASDRIRPGRLPAGRQRVARRADAGPGAGSRRAVCGRHGALGRHGGVLRDEGPAAARRELLCVPHAVRDGGPARRLARGAAEGWRDGPGPRARRSGEEHAAQGDSARRRLPAHAARARQAAGRRHRGAWPSGFVPARSGRGRRTRPPRRSAAPEKAITPEQRAFWSFQPLASHTPPPVSNTAWPRTDIDRFILARLEKEGLSPVAPASRLALLRRATLDLTGLPPTPEEVDAFLNDDSPEAFEKVVDRLLASPAYGEAWGRHLAGCRAVWRGRLPQPRSRGPRPQPVSERPPVSRLGDPRLQRRPAVRPVRHRAARGRSPGGAGAGSSPARARLPRARSLVLRQRRGGDHARRRAPRSC